MDPFFRHRYLRLLLFSLFFSHTPYVLQDRNDVLPGQGQGCGALLRSTSVEHLDDSGQV